MARPSALLSRGACACALLVAIGGCATIHHSLSAGAVAGRTLSTRGGEGAERLQTELEVDSTLRDFVAANGRPDYIHVVDRMSLYFFYVGEDRAAKFERDLLPPSVARDFGRIPGSLLKLLPKREVEQIIARRGAVQKRHVAQVKAQRRAAPAPAPVPAARASGRYMSRFDVRQIVARMRPPLTAADAGVSGWRKVKFSDGISGTTAQVGGTRYEVRSDRVVIAMAISGSRTTPPPQARLEVLRANTAVFGAHAKAVTEQVMGLMERVAADRSGRTPAAQRLRGRNVRIDRTSGRIVYAIRP